MPGVTGGLLDEVEHDPPDRPRVHIVGEPRHTVGNRYGAAQVGDLGDDRLGLGRDVAIPPECGGEGFVRPTSEIVLVGPSAPEPESRCRTRSIHPFSVSAPRRSPSVM